jgi:nucleosome binding factor SPN SPT16 subunit
MQKQHGVISKLQALGPFAEEWQQSYEEISKDVEEVDITNALSTAAMATKDEKELVSLVLASVGLIRTN